MSETQPAVSVRYFLNLEESQDGFALATFGKKQITRFITPLVSIGVIIWGPLTLSFSNTGKASPFPVIFLAFIYCIFPI